MFVAQRQSRCLACRRAQAQSLVPVVKDPQVEGDLNHRNLIKNQPAGVLVIVDSTNLDRHIMVRLSISQLHYVHLSCPRFTDWGIKTEAVA